MEPESVWEEDWREIFRGGVSNAQQLAELFDLDAETIRRIEKEFPLRINKYYLSLIQEKGDPIWKQVVPDIRELQGELGYACLLYTSPSPRD